MSGCDGTPIGAGSSEVSTRRYRCSVRDHLKRAADALDAYVEQVVVDVLARPESADLLDGGSGDGPVVSLHRHATSARARLDEYSLMFAQGEVDRQQPKVGIQRIRDELAAIETQLADLAAGSALDGIAGRTDADEVWVGLTLERNAVIDAVVEVTVLPARRGGTGAFDPAFVRVVERRSTS